jgi:RHS repeat-associated protein
VNYIYDSLGRLDQMTDSNDKLIVDYDYHAAGLLSRKTLGNGTYTTYVYDSLGNLTSLVNYKPDNSVISSFVYTYNASGLRTSETTLESKRTYEYNANGQLVKVTYPDNKTTEYVYDSVGNRIRVIENGVPTDYVTNNLNQYSQVGNVSYIYDADGNMTSKTESGITTTYTYNDENRLVQVSTPTDTWIYAYDALGNRTATSHNGTVTNCLIDPIGYGNLIAEYDSSGVSLAKYEHGYGLLSKTEQSGNSYWYHFNAIGSTSEMTADNSAVMNNYTFDPFGITIYAVENISNHFKYIGEFGIQREENGLDYMRARFYLTYEGRFTNCDPISILGNINTYLYCNNSPTSNVDPGGLYSVHDAVCTISIPIIQIFRNMEYFNIVSIVIGHDRHWGWRQEHLEEEAIGYYQIVARQHDADLKQSNRFCLNILDDEVRTAHLRLLVGYEMAVWEDIKTYCGWFKDPTKILDPNIPSEPNEPTKKRTMVDPNRKRGPAGYGTSGYIPKDQLMTYTIDFENMSDATAPAHIVRVTDVLEENFD